MGETPDPTVQRRRLRHVLRRARTDAGFTQREVAEALDWSPSKLLRIENGKVGISTTDLKALLAQYNVDDPQLVQEFVRAAHESRHQAWDAYKDVLVPEFVTYLAYESSASVILTCEPTVVPGLLQTEEYMRSLSGALTNGDYPSEVLDRQVKARLKRQELLDQKNPPKMFFVLDEAAIRRRVGSEAGNPAVMRHQLEKLKTLGERPHITIQILPFSVGAHHGMRGSFVILKFPDPQDGPLLFQESSRGTFVSRDSPDETERYLSTFWDLETRATQGSESNAFIDKVLSEMQDLG
jgi:transcriptional regulator with XRE-family HTH domain